MAASPTLPSSHPVPTLPPAPPCLLLQGRGTNPALERGEAEDAFRSHVQDLYEAALEAFLDLLDAEIKVSEWVGWWGWVGGWVGGGWGGGGGG